jgi:hypothetical protein
MQIRALIVSVLLALALVPAITSARVPASIAATALAMFDSEATARKHCPRDVVVWLNTSSGIYHEKGMRWYGCTKHGACGCKKEADGAGDRDTRNGTMSKLLLTLCMSITLAVGFSAARATE